MELLQQAGKRQETAAVYHQLGRVAEEEKEFALSLEYFAAALEIFSEYKDKYHLEIVIESLSILLHTEEPGWEPGAAIEGLAIKEEIKDAIRKIISGK